MERVAVITGATSDIGAAAARMLALCGYAVALVARRQAVLEPVAHEIERSGGRAEVIAADVTRAGDVESVFARIEAIFGRLDAAFNNVGAATAPSPLVEISADAFSQSLQTNVMATFLCMSAEIRAMLANSGGAIVNMSSTAGLQGVSGLGAYCAAKHAVVGLSKAAALDYAGQRVRVNILAPGPIATQRIPAAYHARIAEHVPLQRIGKPEDVAQAVQWLCSDAAQFVTGTVITLDGGRLAGTASFANG